MLTYAVIDFLLRYYKAPLPLIGVPFSQICRLEGKYLAGVIDISLLNIFIQNVSDMFSHTDKPSPWNFFQVIAYYTVLLAMALPEIALFVETVTAIIAFGIGALLGPLFIALYVFPFSWCRNLFWAWVHNRKTRKLWSEAKDLSTSNFAANVVSQGYNDIRRPQPEKPVGIENLRRFIGFRFVQHHRDIESRNDVEGLDGTFGPVKIAPALAWARTTDKASIMRRSVNICRSVEPGRGDGQPSPLLTTHRGPSRLQWQRQTQLL